MSGFKAVPSYLLLFQNSETLKMTLVANDEQETHSFTKSLQVTYCTSLEILFITDSEVSVSCN